MNIVISGNLDPGSLNDKKPRIHKVLRPGYTLHVGSECNDGRPITESWRYKQAVKMGIPIIRQEAEQQLLAGKETKENLVNKYSPRAVQDIIGHKEQITQIKNWLSSWNDGYPDKRGILVTGPPGIGKTTTIHLIAKTLGYKVTEYNASDTRSVAVLRGIMALGIRRLVKEIIVMDEIDGISERGGVGELADIIKKTQTPILCIANEKPPKLRPIMNACLDIKFSRPNKSTIATALLRVAKAEGIQIAKEVLEEMCEKNGNDIRSIMNSLEFYREGGAQGANGDKDATLRLDLFSATQRLIGNKKIKLDDSANLVFVDYNMVPLMVQEAYIASSRNSLENVVKAADYISCGDIINRRVHQRHDWSLLPHYVQSTVAAARTVSGPAPFQIFPSWLGKNSKRLKHRRFLDNLSAKRFCSNDEMRLDYADPLQTILFTPLCVEKPNIGEVIKKMDSIHFTRDDIVDNLQEVMLEKIEIPTKVRTAFTKEYNKTHPAVKVSKVKKRKAEEMGGGEDDEGSDGDEDGASDTNSVDDLEQNMELLSM